MEIGSLVVSVLGLVVSSVGFFFTVKQMSRTADAAEATERAINTSSARMQLNYLMVLLPEFKTFEQELDDASDSNDKKFARRVLVSYSHAANRVATLLMGSEFEEEKELAAALRTSAESASNAKSSIVSGAAESVLIAVQDVVVQMGDVSRRAEGLLASYQMKVA